MMKIQYKEKKTSRLNSCVILTGDGPRLRKKPTLISNCEVAEIEKIAAGGHNYEPKSAWVQKKPADAPASSGPTVR